MSFSGITTFNNNLKIIMESDAFKKSDDVGKLHIGGALLFSKYGVIGKTTPVPPDKKDN